MKKTIFFIIFFFLISCSGTVNVFVTEDCDLKKYKTAYVDLLEKDEFNLGAAIMAHIGRMGFAVKPTPLSKEVLDSDFLVKYHYSAGWDLKKYLKSFSLQFLDAKSGTLLLNSRYELTGIWASNEYRIDYTFNNIREKTGFPSLEDFD